MRTRSRMRSQVYSGISRVRPLSLKKCTASMGLRVCYPDTSPVKRLQHFVLTAEAVAYRYANTTSRKAEQDPTVGPGDDMILGSYIHYMGTSSGHDSHPLLVRVSY